MPILFLGFVFLTGGGSRSDLTSLPLLRGGAILFAFGAMLQMDRSDWRRIRVPLLLLIAMTLWMIVQLIPLPPALWQSLPGRETIVAVDRLLGQPDLWRPISLTPSQSFDSLLAMTVPFGALLIFSRGDVEGNTRILFAILCIGCGSALMGFMQMLSGPSSGAYLYRITNSNEMVGLFANRNHNAMLLASAVMISAMLLRDEFMRRKRRDVVSVCLGLIGLGVAVVTILVGSRAGLVAVAIAFAVGYVMVTYTWRSRGLLGEPKVQGRRVTVFPRWVVHAPVALIAMLLAAAFWASDRSTGLTRIMAPDVAADMRFQAWPIVRSMVETFWVFGSGFGSFPDVYEMFEPDRLLQPSYFNHAHNDWAEILITGGLPAAIILLATIVWIARAALRGGLGSLLKGYRGDTRLSALVILLLLAMGSLVDYPLRVPSIQVLAILMVILLCCPSSASTRRD